MKEKKINECKKCSQSVETMGKFFPDSRQSLESRTGGPFAKRFEDRRDHSTTSTFSTQTRTESRSTRTYTVTETVGGKKVGRTKKTERISSMIQHISINWQIKIVIHYHAEVGDLQRH